MEGTKTTGNSGKPDDTLKFLDQCVKKILKVRHAWDILFRVLPPTLPDRPYSVILEKGTVTEQVLLNQKDVSRSETAGTDVFLSTDIRNAVRRLEKRAVRKSSLHS